MKVSSKLLLQCVEDDLSTFLVDSPERSYKQEAALRLRSSILKKYSILNRGCWLTLQL